ncbi:hypothetical protein PsorP6_017184 [Peronosclerospora sorghi]|uniref:Uncharacterized protein n=1 Tax=Peronosclerospora sorghi TaxID=230839 RepID=A0ACC0WEG7_9STRA|nr:hypothetical protein PsorP6_017184 [Peronosclerospora sorghi]
MIIERFAEVPEETYRPLEKELDLAIEEAQQNLELTKELGETIQKQELQIAENLVEKHKWEEKYHLAAHEVETLKIEATYQIQQLESEVWRLRQAGLDVESSLKGQESSYETFKQYNDTLRLKLKKFECNISEHVQENRKVEQKNFEQSDMMQSLHQEVNELHEHHESVLIKAKGLEQDVTVWQEKYKEKKKQIHEMENALMHGRQQVKKQDEILELVKAENRKLQEHMDMMAQEHEKHLADH